MFFHQASKGNPGKAGGGGVIIICPERNIEVEFFWDIGFDSNNMAEVYWLWQDLNDLADQATNKAMGLCKNE